MRGLLQVEPGNRQAQDLVIVQSVSLLRPHHLFIKCLLIFVKENVIKKKMEKEGLIGMAVVGGAALAFGGLLGLGIALAKSSKSS